MDSNIIISELSNKYKEIQNICDNKDVKSLIKKDTNLNEEILSIKDRSFNESSSFIDFLSKFYLSAEKIVLLKDRIEEDRRVLSDLLYNIYLSEFMLNKILDRVEEQNYTVSPKVYDSFSLLQKTLIELIKIYEVIKDNIEKKYKEYKSEGESSDVAINKTFDNVYTSSDILDILNK